jgi:hypothetical protein
MYGRRFIGLRLDSHSDRSFRLGEMQKAGTFKQIYLNFQGRFQNVHIIGSRIIISCQD